MKVFKQFCMMAGAMTLIWGQSYDIVIQGSMERLNPVLMTALTTGLALLPLALTTDKPGSEIQSPMSIVILGGLLTATFLNLIVVPVLFAKWGRKPL